MSVKQLIQKIEGHTVGCLGPMVELSEANDCHVKQTLFLTKPIKTIQTLPNQVKLVLALRSGQRVLQHRLVTVINSMLRNLHPRRDNLQDD